MTYSEFVTAYKLAFENCMNYRMDQIGSGIYIEEMAKLSDDYPLFMERFDAECEPEFTPVDTGEELPQLSFAPKQNEQLRLI